MGAVLMLVFTACQKEYTTSAQVGALKTTNCWLAIS